MLAPLVTLIKQIMLPYAVTAPYLLAVDGVDGVAFLEHQAAGVKLRPHKRHQPLRVTTPPEN